jgi:hypothetical protein
MAKSAVDFDSCPDQENLPQMRETRGQPLGARALRARPTEGLQVRPLRVRLRQAGRPTQAHHGCAQVWHQAAQGGA